MQEWRSLGVQQSRGWVHYELHRPEPHILLFRRPKGTDPATGLPPASFVPPSDTFVYWSASFHLSNHQAEPVKVLDLGSNFLTLKVFKIELSVITLVYIEPSITTPKIMRILRRVLIVVQSKVLVPNLLLSTSYYPFGKSRILICQLENHSFHFVNATFALDGLIIFVTAD